MINAYFQAPSVLLPYYVRFLLAASSLFHVKILSLVDETMLRL